MTPAAVLLDSSSDLDLLQANELGVDLLIQTVHFSGEALLDMSDLDPAILFHLLNIGRPYPALAPVSVDAYARMLERMLLRAEHVLALHPMYYSAQQLGAMQEAAARFAGRVTVFPTRAMSTPMALVAQDAQQLFTAGATPQQVVAALKERQSQTRTTVYLNDSSYLRRGGSLPQLMQQIPEHARPLLGAPGNELQYLGAAATPATGYRMLQDRFQRELMRMGTGRLALFYSPEAEEAADIFEKEARRLGVTEVIRAGTGLIASAYLGPGSLGYALAPLHY